MDMVHVEDLSCFGHGFEARKCTDCQLSGATTETRLAQLESLSKLLCPRTTRAIGRMLASGTGTHGPAPLPLVHLADLLALGLALHRTGFYGALVGKVNRTQTHHILNYPLIHWLAARLAGTQSGRFLDRGAGTLCTVRLRVGLGHLSPFGPSGLLLKLTIPLLGKDLCRTQITRASQDIVGFNFFPSNI